VNEQIYHGFIEEIDEYIWINQLRPVRPKKPVKKLTYEDIYRFPVKARRRYTSSV